MMQCRPSEEQLNKVEEKYEHVYVHIRHCTIRTKEFVCECVNKKNSQGDIEKCGQHRRT